MNIGLAEGAFLALVCVGVNALTVLWLTRGRASDKSGLLEKFQSRDKVFLFEDDHFIEASSEARKFIRTDISGFNWAQLHKSLAPSYPGFPKSSLDVEKQLDITIEASDPDRDGDILCEWIDGITRVHLRGPSVERHHPSANIQELESLRETMGQAPYPVWHVESGGEIGWHNAAYEKLKITVGGENANTRPLMFPSVSGKGQAGKKTRTSVAVTGSEQKLWFDVSVMRQKNGFLCYAVDINAVVEAEVAQRNFVQTLAKTFAQLSIGLAIFDRNQQLVLFNPALIDLTALPADFLSGRPNLLSFFDRLRDHRMMPEPKNYNSWRHQMADLLAAAADGRYQETWTLPSGAVYSVSGRPHPDGAVAFLIEDITAEITLTRRFRTDLEINQSMLDQMEDAIVVFSNNGTLCFSNKAYVKLWNVDPDESFVQMTVMDSIQTWQNDCKPTSVLGDVREFIVAHENRVEWWDQIELRTSQPLTIGIFPISHGATMVIFSRVNTDRVLANANPPPTKTNQPVEG